jgi:hypothetical protein
VQETDKIFPVLMAEESKELIKSQTEENFDLL